ncbi:MAG: DUF3500 domain-containing protein [Actinobacteria bacterium]|nr:DUF3500 domain-containing protein [Actinomycetota bacterium]
MTTSAQLAQAAQAWLDTLDDTRRQQASRPFDDARRQWAYTPGRRDGVAFAGMPRDQAKAAHRLLASVLRPHVHAQVAAIMGLEDVLDGLEGGRRDRHAGDYWMIVHGEPGATAWGWRLEGHHVSLNVTVAAGDVRCEPLFLGANPARLAAPGGTVLAPLGREEELGFALLWALPPGRRDQAWVSMDAPGDVLTDAAAQLDGSVDAQGVALGALVGEADRLADTLLEVYLERTTGGDDTRRDRITAGRDQLRFAWAGGDQPGQPHYYRLQGSRLLIELDNTQNDANHVHTVCRDPLGDFGDDLLRAHIRAGQTPDDA